MTLSPTLTESPTLCHALRVYKQGLADLRGCSRSKREPALGLLVQGYCVTPELQNMSGRDRALCMLMYPHNIQLLSFHVKCRHTLATHHTSTRICLSHTGCEQCVISYTCAERQTSTEAVLVRKLAKNNNKMKNERSSVSYRPSLGSECLFRWLLSVRHLQKSWWTYTDSKTGEQCTVAAAPECSFWQEVMRKSGKYIHTATLTAV